MAEKGGEMIDEVGAGWPRRGHGQPITLLAHRGGIGPWRENTLEALAGALRLGADGVELDVRRTSDGRLVVHHDVEIAGLGAIHDLPARQLPAWVPGLDDALETCAGATVNVEIKNAPVEPGFDPDETVAAAVVATLAASGRDRGRSPDHVIVSSFWPATLAAVRASGSAVATGLLVHPSLDAAQAAEQAVALGCVALHPFHSRATPDLVDLVHGLDMSVVVWTVNEPRDVAAAAAAGVDVVISDRVGDSLAALGR
jgi:glycerophosphoryl diester phosphodiesterase